MTPQPHRARLMAGALTLMLGLALSACGESDSEVAPEATTSPSTSLPTESESETAEPMGPACDEVWVAGNVLPNNYNGCQDGEKDAFVQAMVYRCSSGQRLVTFRRNFYAAKGEVINETPTALARDAGFKKVLASCGA